MSTSIEITHAQAQTLSTLSGWEGPLAIRQLDGGDDAGADDIYVAPRGSTSGFRIAPDGAMSDMGAVLPAR